MVLAPDRGQIQARCFVSHPPLAPNLHALTVVVSFNQSLRRSAYLYRPRPPVARSKCVGWQGQGGGMAMTENLALPVVTA